MLEQIAEGHGADLNGFLDFRSGKSPLPLFFNETNSQVHLIGWHNDRVHPLAGEELDLTNGVEIIGRFHCQVNKTRFHFKRKDTVFENDAGWQYTHDVFINANLEQIGALGTVLSAKEDQQRLILDVAQLNENGPNLMTFFRLDFESMIQLCTSEQTLSD